MPTDYTPKNWTTGSEFDPADATEMSHQIDEEETINTSQEAEIGVLQARHTVTIQEWVSTSGTTYNLTGQAVPTGAIGVRVTVIPAGVGGGSGRRGAAGTVRCGGGGGAGVGNCRDVYVPVSPTDTWNLNLGAPGVGGAAVTTDDTNGNTGTTGNSSAYWTLVGKCVVKGWTNTSAGAGGTNATGTAGVGSIGEFTGANGGAASTTGAAGGAGTFGTGGVPGAGAGGGITSGNVANNGGAGGNQYVFDPTGAASGAGGVVGGASPGTGTTPTVGGILTPSAGGGAASTTGAAQAGADGVGYGSPGGGGGASTNGNASGRGGNGGPGYVRLEWVYA